MDEDHISMINGHYDSEGNPGIHKLKKGYYLFQRKEGWKLAHGEMIVTEVT